jgi:hypothetical protein
VAELDFTALNKLAYRGFETEEEQEKKDALIEQGFSLVEADKDNPFLKDAPTASQTALEPPQASALSNSTSAPKNASQGKIEAFTDVSGKRNYNALYRAAHDYHKRHSPPIVDRAYWETHIAGEDEPPQAELDYWEEAATDIAATANAYSNDPFLNGLLVAVYEELEREYQSLRGYNKTATK